MKNIKNLFGRILLPFILTFLVGTAVHAKIPAVSDNFYANDFANVMSNGTINYIVSENQKLFDSTGAEIVVTAVTSTGGMEIDEYAYQMFNEWRIGSAERNNGVLFLISTMTDAYWVIVGQGLENYAADIAGIVVDTFESYYVSGDYDKGIQKTFDNILDEVYSIYGGASNGSGSNNYGTEGSSPIGYAASIIGGFFKFIFLACVVVFVLVMLSVTGRRRRFYNSPVPGIPPVVIVPWYRRMFLPTHHHNHRPTHHTHHQKPAPPRNHRSGSFGGFTGGGTSRGAGGGRSGNTFGGGGRSSGSFGGGGRSSGSSGGGGRSGGGRSGGGMSRGAGGGRK